MYSGMFKPMMMAAVQALQNPASWHDETMQSMQKEEQSLFASWTA